MFFTDSFSLMIELVESKKNIFMFYKVYEVRLTISSLISLNLTHYKYLVCIL
jgi:hypothetical protein